MFYNNGCDFWEVFKISTAQNALIFFNNDKPAYITKRFDLKPGGGKYLQEDFASIAGKTKSNAGDDFKYQYSYLQLGKLISNHVSAVEVELEKFFKIIVFNYLFLNGDAHLKNFSLIESPNGDFIMSPAYDLLCTRIHVEDSYMALKDGLSEAGYDHPSFSTLGCYGYDDFLDFGLELGLNEVRIRRTIDTMRKEDPLIRQLISNSYLDNETKELYYNLYKGMLKRINNSIGKRF